MFDMNSLKDPRGIEGILSRGRNVYAGGLPSAPGAGRPMGTVGTPSPGSGPQAGGFQGFQNPQGNNAGNPGALGVGGPAGSQMMVRPPIQGQLGGQGYDQATIRLQLGNRLNGPRLG